MVVSNLNGNISVGYILICDGMLIYFWIMLFGGIGVGENIVVN